MMNKKVMMCLEFVSLGREQDMVLKLWNQIC